MSGNVENADLRCEQLRELAERRHAASVACHLLASAAKTAEDRILYEEMARRTAEEAEKLERTVSAWRTQAA